jgi:phosphatidylglycerophosphate synthase
MSVRNYVNPANAITASRYLTLPPFLYFLDRGDDQLALLTVLISGIADLVDGPVARLFKCTSGFGELFDAITDAICYGFYIVCLCAYDRIPWPPIVFLVGASVVNAWMRAAYARRVGRATNYRSFAMERLVVYAAYIAGCAAAGFEATFYAWFIPPMMTIILVHDYKRMLVDPVPS